MTDVSTDRRATNRALDFASMTDADLVDHGLDLMGSLRELAEPLGTSERALSNARQMSGPNAGTPLPTGVRELVIKLIRQDGFLEFPPPPPHTGRKETEVPQGGNMKVRLLPAEIERFERLAEAEELSMGAALTDAVKTYLANHRRLPRSFAVEGQGGQVSDPVPQGTEGYRCRIDLEVLEQLNRRAGQVGWRRVYLRHAVLEWMDLPGRKTERKPKPAPAEKRPPGRPKTRT